MPVTTNDAMVREVIVSGRKREASFIISPPAAIISSSRGMRKGNVPKTSIGIKEEISVIRNERSQLPCIACDDAAFSKRRLTGLYPNIFITYPFAELRKEHIIKLFLLRFT